LLHIQFFKQSISFVGSFVNNLSGDLSDIVFNVIFSKSFAVFRASAHNSACASNVKSAAIIIALALCCSSAIDKFYLLTSVFVEYDERVEVGGKAL